MNGKIPVKLTDFDEIKKILQIQNILTQSISKYIWNILSYQNFNEFDEIKSMEKIFKFCLTKMLDSKDFIDNCQKQFRDNVNDINTDTNIKFNNDNLEFLNQEVMLYYDIFQTYCVNMYIANGEANYSYMLTSFTETIKENSEDNGIDKGTVNYIKKSIEYYTKNNILTPLKLHKNIIIDDDYFHYLDYIYKFTGIINDKLMANDIELNKSDIIIIPNKIYNIKTNERTSIPINNNNIYDIIHVSKDDLIERVTVDKNNFNDLNINLNMDINSKCVVFVLDRRNRNEDVIYIYVYDIKQEHDIIYHQSTLNYIANDYKYDSGILMMTNLYRNNISKSCMYFNNEYLRFFPEYITKLLNKYFIRDPSNDSIKEYLDKLYSHQYKHGYPFVSCQNDNTFFKNYRLLVNNYFYTVNYKRSTNNIENSVNDIKCNSDNLETCEYIEYIINEFNGVNPTDEENKNGLLIKSFIHIQNEHDLFESKEYNKRIISYFESKLDSCPQANGCKKLTVHITDQNDDTNSNDNDAIKLYDDIMNSLHIYLLHPMSFIRDQRNRFNRSKFTQKNVDNSENNESKNDDNPLLQMGTNYNYWLKCNETESNDSLKKEITNKQHQHHITMHTYNNILAKCKELRKCMDYQYTDDELMSLKMYTDLDNKQYHFRRCFWDNNDAKAHRKEVIQWAQELHKAFIYGAKPVFTSIYHGLSKTFITKRINDILFYGPISTTIDAIIANNFSKNKGTLWEIQSDLWKPFGIIYGINMFQTNISRFVEEKEILLFNTNLYIKSTNVNDITTVLNSNNDKIYKAYNYLFNYLINLTTPIKNKSKFFTKIGFPFKSIKVKHLKLLKNRPEIYNKLSHKTLLNDTSFTLLRIYTELIKKDAIKNAIFSDKELLTIFVKNISKYCGFIDWNDYEYDTSDDIIEILTQDIDYLTTEYITTDFGFNDDTITYLCNFLINYPHKISKELIINQLGLDTKILNKIQIHSINTIIEEHGKDKHNLFVKTAYIPKENHPINPLYQRLATILNTMVICKTLKPKEAWNLSTTKGGYIKLEYKVIIVLKDNKIKVNGMGFYGNNDYNKGKGTNNNSFAGFGTPGKGKHGGNPYGSKELDILYHGSGCMDESEGIGGGIIDIQCDKLINYGKITSNPFKRGSGGSIFILAKDFINYGTICAQANLHKFENEYDRKFGLGRIAIYCDNYTNKNEIIPKPHLFNYNAGKEILYQRKKRAINIKCIECVCVKNDDKKMLGLILQHNIVDMIENTIDAGEFKIRLYNYDDDDEYFVNINAEYVYCGNILFNVNNMDSIDMYSRYQILYARKNNTFDDIKMNDTILYNGVIDNGVTLSSDYIRPKKWNIEWNHETNKGGYIRLKYNIIMILPNGEINANGMGYYGDNTYNKGKGIKDVSSAGYGTNGKHDHGGISYGSEVLKTLYHGSGCKNKKYGIGGGIIDIHCNKLINYGSITANSYKAGSGGSIFILTKEFINKGNVYAKGNKNSRESGLGRIAIYCDKYTNNGSIIPEPYLKGKYLDGKNIVDNRKIY